MRSGARHENRSLPACPRCGPYGNVKLNGMKGNRQRFLCTRCDSEVRPDPAPTLKGSGVIAGRIEIGRGSVWGAGPV